MASKPPTTRTDRRDRVDVLRNRERLLSAAKVVYAEEGTDAPLKTVAERAGLGVGTVYRHFATQEALVAAVLTDHLAAMDKLAVVLGDTLEPDNALTEWLAEFVARLTVYRGLARLVMPELRDHASPLGRACQRMRTAGAELLAQAQRDGSMRADIDVAMLLTLANAAALVVEQRPDQSRLALSVLINGLRLAN